jgi:hypothetical protein
MARRSYKVLVHRLGSIELGKKTEKNSGMQIEIYDGPTLLGTIEMGQGSFAWYSPKAKQHTLHLSWTEFAQHLNDLALRA